MSLPVPVVGVDTGPDYANNIDACLTILDAHTHALGSGIPIVPAGLNINADLNFQSNNAYALRTTRFTAQSAVLALGSDVGCLYVVGNELYYNDVSGGNKVQITLNGTVNATSSGISSGTNTAAFSSNVLVVKENSTTAANVKMQSALLTNSSSLTNILTLSAPTLSSSYALYLPAIPAATGFVTIDTSGNFSGATALLGVLTHSNLSSSAGILGTQLANNTVTGTQISTSLALAGSLTVATTLGITGTTTAAAINASGTVTAANLTTAGTVTAAQVLANGDGVMVTNSSVSGNLSVTCASFDSSGAGVNGQGATCSHNGTGDYTVTLVNGLGANPVVTANATSNLNVAITSVSASTARILISDGLSTPTDSGFNIIIVGVR